MTREQAVSTLGKGQGYYTRSLLGKAYDCGKEEATEDAYRKGFSDANRYACKVMVACSYLALHEVYGFGKDRMQRFADAFRAKLIDVLDAYDAIKECEERFGIVLVDEFLEEDDG